MTANESWHQYSSISSEALRVPHRSHQSSAELVPAPFNILRMPLNSLSLTYPPNWLGAQNRVQRLGAKMDPRRRPISVWRPYKVPSALTSPPTPGRARRVTWPYPAVAAAPDHLAAPGHLAAALGTPSAPPPSSPSTPPTPPPTSPSPGPPLAAADRRRLDLANLTEVPVWCPWSLLWNIPTVGPSKHVTVAPPHPLLRTTGR